MSGQTEQNGVGVYSGTLARQTKIIIGATTQMNLESMLSEIRQMKKGQMFDASTFLRFPVKCIKAENRWEDWMYSGRYGHRQDGRKHRGHQDLEERGWEVFSGCRVTVLWAKHVGVRVRQWCECTWCPRNKHFKIDHTFYVVCYNLNNRNINVSDWWIKQFLKSLIL